MFFSSQFTAFVFVLYETSKRNKDGNARITRQLRDEMEAHARNGEMLADQGIFIAVRFQQLNFSSLPADCG